MGDEFGFENRVLSNGVLLGEEAGFEIGYAGEAERLRAQGLGGFAGRGRWRKALGADGC
jgi:hypothetical protein